MKKIIRTDYSNPAAHGSHIAKIIMKDPDLKESWMKDITKIRNRMRENRKILASALNQAYGEHLFDYIAKGNGFFCQLGFSKEQVEILREKFHIYLTATSRINVIAMNLENQEAVLKALTSL